ncbi:MAG: aminotransferase class V-fold PLP-dependent enzyme [Acidobacteria bacterium]|nr:aminotransferase class V-fold PLP-dependent enzyme [Acidobacteriota bacterium]
MTDSLSKLFSGSLTRRGLFGRGGAAALLGAAGAAAVPEAAEAALEVGPTLYESIGVRPVINCKGTFTIMSGSLSLPEVKQAMMEASKHYVQIDDVMFAVGKRIAELAGSESAIVTCGCASALVHATSACIAGGDPEKMQRLPDLTGLKNEVIAPSYSRNVYDHAVRMLGVKMVNVNSLEEMRTAIGPRTAMVMVLASPPDAGPFGLEPIAKLAHEFGVPVIVDAAAEDFNPKVHLDRGADLVAYSGGKALRGPQSAGVLLGRKDLIRAAWMNSSPHHAFGRPMKIGKEDIMGMLAAVEMWFKRDHAAEQRRWREWLDEIATSVKRVNGVTTEVQEPRGLSNNTPRLDISWNGDKLGVYGQQIEKMVYEGDPRIVLGGARGNQRQGGESSVSITPWMMEPTDAKVVAEVLYKILSNPPALPKMSKAGKPVEVEGQWDFEMGYLLSPAHHKIVFEQDGDGLLGLHEGDRTGGDLSGWVDGDTVHFSSRHPWEGTSIGFNFTGKVSGDTMTGEVDMGEYFTAPFTAKRHTYGRRRPPQRPQKNV